MYAADLDMGSCRKRGHESAEN